MLRWLKALFRKKRNHPKTSVMLMDVARDFVNAPENFKTIQFHLELAVTSWNIACVECATTRKILLNDFLKNFKGKYTRKQVISLKTDIQRFIAKKDAILFDGKQKYKLYSNQYIPLTKHCDMHDRIRLQGMYDSKVGGGSILHINVSSIMSKEQMLELMLHTTSSGVKYFGVNYGISQCKTCGKTYVGRYDKSPCHDADVNRSLRIVGYEVPVSAWSKERREEYEERQFYTPSK